MATMAMIGINHVLIRNPISALFSASLSAYQSHDLFHRPSSITFDTTFKSSASNYAPIPIGHEVNIENFVPLLHERRAVANVAVQILSDQPG
jgi:hypothetical protein